MLVLRLRSALTVLTLERKSMPIVAWYILSKESYMNRVIRDVLPTVVIVVSDVGSGQVRNRSSTYRSALLETPAYKAISKYK
jgi:hypothetical protein